MMTAVMSLEIKDVCIQCIDTTTDFQLSLGLCGVHWIDKQEHNSVAQQYRQ